MFSKSKMAEVIFSQSGGELRIQDGGSGSQQRSLETRSKVSIGVCFGREKLPTGLEGFGSVYQTCPICQMRISLYACKSNEKELYFQKS